jgi:hypothetical protein
LFVHGQEYLAKAPNETQAAPRYSRRTQLANELVDGRNPQFNRNIVNRLWGLLFGRGLIDPPDLHHADNPAVDSQLLTLLTDEFVVRHFDMRDLLRELVLTRAYQRSSEAPPPAALPRDYDALKTLISQLRSEEQRLIGELALARGTAEKTAGVMPELLKSVARIGTRKATAEQARDAAKTAAAAATSEATALDRESLAKQELMQLLSVAQVKSQAAAKEFASDKFLPETAALVAGQVERLTAEVAAMRAAAEAAKLRAQSATLWVGHEERVADAALVVWSASRSEVELAQQRVRTAWSGAHVVRARLHELQAKLADAELVLALHGASQISQEDWSGVIVRSRRRFLVRSLKPLTPESSAWSIMRVLGLVEQAQAAAEPEVTAELLELSAAQKSAREASILERKVDEKLRGHLTTFAQVFGQGPGQPDYGFQATVQQALFLSNGPLINNWLQPADNVLIERLARLVDSVDISEELYLSVLSRPATADERAEVAQALAKSVTDREAALSELVWSLLASAEFRFNH